MSANDFFKSHIIFRFAEYKQFMQGRGQGATDKNCHITLYQYCKKGVLTHVRRGLYLVNYDNPHLDVMVSAPIIAAKATDDAVLAYHTALESHGIAYTDFNSHVFLSACRSNSFEFQNQYYSSIYRPNLKRYEYTKQFIEHSMQMGIVIYRTTLERTIVDVLDRPDLSGGWEEVLRSLDHVTTFNVKQCVDYALTLNRLSIVAKLGYFLDQLPDYLQADNQQMERLLEASPKQPYYVDRNAKGGHTYIKKWQLMIPNFIHKRQWEEPIDAIDH